MPIKNRERRNRLARVWREKNKDRLKVYNRARMAQPKYHTFEFMEKRRIAARTQGKAYYQKHKHEVEFMEKKRAQSRSSARRNSTRRKKLYKKWVAKHPMREIVRYYLGLGTNETNAQIVKTIQVYRKLKREIINVCNEMEY